MFITISWIECLTPSQSSFVSANEKENAYSEACLYVMEDELLGTDFMWRFTHHFYHMNDDLTMIEVFEHYGTNTGFMFCFYKIQTSKNGAPFSIFELSETEIQASFWLWTNQRAAFDTEWLMAIYGGISNNSTLLFVSSDYSEQFSASH